MSIPIGIVGVSGYGGGEVLRLCASHPNFEEAACGSQTQVNWPYNPRIVGHGHPVHEIAGIGKAARRHAGVFRVMQLHPVADGLVELARDVRLSWLADRVVLYKSNLGHGPTHYEALADAELAGP